MGKKYLLYLSTSFFIILLSGCETLPPGTPPEGQIVKVTTSTNKALSIVPAVDCMATAIVTSEEFTGNHLLPVVRLLPTKRSDTDYKYGLDSFNILLYKKLLEMEVIVVPFKSPPTLMLQSEFDEVTADKSLNADKVIFTWKVKLLAPSSSKTLWDYQILIEMAKKCEQ